MYLGQSYKAWRDHLTLVLDRINNALPRWSRSTVMTNYFTGQRPVALPQNEEKFYKYKVGETVRYDLPKQLRRWPYKFSLQSGKLPIIS